MLGSKARHVKREEADAGDKGGAAGGAESTVAEQIAAAVAKEVSGLKAKNAELIAKNKGLSETMAQFDGIDPVKTKEMLKHFDNSEEARLMAEGKIDEVIAKRTAKRDEEIARQLAEKDGEVTKAKEYASRFNMRVLHNEIRASAPPDLHPSALEDVLRHAAEMFSLDEEGNVVPKDGALGKNGKAPYSPKEWFEDTRGTHPHRFANGNSGSSGFQGAGKGGAKTISRDKFMSMSPAEQKASHKAGITVVDR